MVGNDNGKWDRHGGKRVTIVGNGVNMEGSSVNIAGKGGRQKDALYDSEE